MDPSDSVRALLRKTDRALDDARYLLADDRAEAAVNRTDYDAFVTFDPETADDLLTEVRRFNAAVRRLLDAGRE